MPFRLCVPTTLVIDPTRRLHRARKLLDLPPSELEMHHMTLVRTDIESKLRNVSNRSNYSADVRPMRLLPPPLLILLPTLQLFTNAERLLS